MQGGNNMLFQEKVINIIDDYVLRNNLPHTIMLEGDSGCGKRTLCDYIANKLNTDVVDITENISLQTLEEIQLSVITKVYYIDSEQISVKEQNAILKFLEEPLKNAYIVLATVNKNLLLPTVVNRCANISFDKYSIEQLRTFLEDENNSIVLKYAQTPGQVKKFLKHNIFDMESFAKKILTQVSVANYSNILKIPNNINFSKEESSLFDFDVFKFILINVANNLYKEKLITYAMFDIVNQFNRECNIPRINKQHLFENFIIRLKQGTDAV